MMPKVLSFWMLVASLVTVSTLPATAAPNRTSEVLLGDIDTLIRNHFVFTTESGQRYRVENEVNVFLSRTNVKATVSVKNGSHFVTIPGIPMALRCTLLTDTLPVAATGQGAPAATIADGSAQRR
ncbi:MAG: hypothetical protein ACON3Z_18335 [Bradymonadia bacterium]